MSNKKGKPLSSRSSQNKKKLTKVIIHKRIRKNKSLLHKLASNKITLRSKKKLIWRAGKHFLQLLVFLIHRALKNNRPIINRFLNKQQQALLKKTSIHSPLRLQKHNILQVGSGLFSVIGSLLKPIIGSLFSGLLPK